MGRSKGNRKSATSEVLTHVERARFALKSFGVDRVSSAGEFIHPQFQTTTLKVARDEMQKAIEIMEKTKWFGPLSP